MTPGNERQQRVAASFTRQYYTLMVQTPEKLPSFYTQNASFNHMGRKATGCTEIMNAVSTLYPAEPDASVKIKSLTTTVDENGHIHLTIKGSTTMSSDMNQNFTHEVELMEHASRPCSFGIVSDKRESTVEKEEPKRWALETPPMFAREPESTVMEPIEQPAPTTVVPAVENSAAKKDVGKFEKMEAHASVHSFPASSPARATAATVTTTTTTAEPQVSLDTDKTVTATATTPEEPNAVPAAEMKKPKSFAEAIMMAKRNGPSHGHVAPITVQAKENKEHATAVTVPKEKKEAPAHANEKNVSKNAPKNSPSTKKKSATILPGENERRNGKILASGSNGKDNNNDVNTKRKAGDGRGLSRFVVFYDIIVKGLPQDATEQTVRDIIEPIAPIKLVQVLSKTDKKDPSVVRTFAFVQLDHNAIKEAGDDVKATVTKVLAARKGMKDEAGHRIQLDEVREKYTVAPNDTAAGAASA